MLATLISILLSTYAMPGHPVGSSALLKAGEHISSLKQLPLWGAIEIQWRPISIFETEQRKIKRGPLKNKKVSKFKR
ncbi:MAG: hypothetical protein EOP06_18725 [Proteobacteria bacterium]|nr:MAG: hypothetical protein EOP06_18725 [Pseudomonadota bacterium]